MVICTVVDNFIRWPRDVETTSLSVPPQPSVGEKVVLILSFPNTISFLSLMCASIPSERTARRTICAVACRSNDVRGRWIEKFVFPRSCQIYSSLEDVYQYPWNFKYTNMIYSPTSTPSANERDSGPPQGRKNWPLSMDSDCALWRHMARRDISTEEVSLWDCVWIAFRFMRSINPFINPKKLQGSDGPVFEGQVKVWINGSWEVYRIVGGYCVDVLGGQITTTWVNTRWCTTNGRREHLVS